MAACESTTAPARPKHEPLYPIPPSIPNREEVFTPLYVRAGEEFSEAPESTVLCTARHIARAHFRTGAPVMQNWKCVYDFVTLQLAQCRREVFGVILLDVHHQLIEWVELFQGSVDGAAVYPRVVMECVLSRNAAAVVLVHNHPSGGTRPSELDREMTGRLVRTLRMVDVEVLDHLIVGKTILSMRTRGMM
jgi:DNA repair protein RadC